MRKLTSIICLVFALIMVLALPVSASAPYQTYTYSIDGKALSSPDVYSPAKEIDSAYMGLDKEIADISDLQVDQDENIYIADSKNNRIIVLDYPAAPIAETSILWIDTPPEIAEDGSTKTPHDYIVKQVALSLNSVSIAVSKVNVRG